MGNLLSVDAVLGLYTLQRTIPPFFIKGIDTFCSKMYEKLVESTV